VKLKIALLGALITMPSLSSAALPAMSDVANCKIDAADWKMVRDGMKKRQGDGWKILASTNPDLTFLELPAPIEVLGFKTTTVAVSDTGLFAQLETADRAALALKLNINLDQVAPYSVALTVPGEKYQSAGDIGGTFLGESEAYRRAVKSGRDGQFAFSRAAYVVFDRYSHPSDTFVGCTYSYEIDTSDAVIESEGQ
jgi:hypothetical protein